MKMIWHRPCCRLFFKKVANPWKNRGRFHTYWLLLKKRWVMSLPLPAGMAAQHLFPRFWKVTTATA